MVWVEILSGFLGGDVGRRKWARRVEVLGGRRMGSVNGDASAAGIVFRLPHCTKLRQSKKLSGVEGPGSFEK